MQYQVKDNAGVVHTITASSARITEVGGRATELRLLNDKMEVVSLFTQWLWFKPVEATK